MDGELASVIPQFIRHNLFLFLVASMGVILFFLGLFVVLSPQDEGVIIEKADSSEATNVSPLPTKEIVVDVEGAVQKPGIYNLPEESREQDAIKAAGGVSSKANFEAIAKGMNMAARLSDGMKLYIPFEDELPTTSTGDQSVIGASTGSISVNSASESQLESLPGVGAVTAGKIISNRPYSSLEDLTAKKAVSNSVFQKIKDLISL
jgi:competence protein ComEA